MTAEASFTGEVSDQMLKDLQSWWEVPSLAQFISLFREPFNLPEIEIEELEKGFIDDTLKGPSTWLQNLILAFLKSIVPGRVNAENWEIQLRKLVKRKLQADEVNPFEEDIAFHELKIRNKVQIVYSLCLYRLDRNDIVELMKSMDAEALRVQKLGLDDEGNTYWYFYGTRLYKEESNEQNKSWDQEWKEQKKKAFKKRGRGRPRKRRIPTSDGESDGFEDVDSKKNNGFMNANEKSRWSVVCDTIEEWVNFAEKFKKSKSKNEATLFKIIQENFLPTLNRIYEEKERKLQEKIRELMPVTVREKIVTRRETRRMRGEVVDRSYINGYSSDEDNKVYKVKDRAQRLEERNKRASEVECIQVPTRNKRLKIDGSNNEFTHDNRNEYMSSSLARNDFNLQSEMEKLLTSIKLHKDAWPFLYPVNADDAPGYYEIIREPIDLSTIQNRLFDGAYETVGDLDADFSKLVSNCELYNGEYHSYTKMVYTLRKIFNKELSKILGSLQPSECTNEDFEGSSDSQYHSSSNSPPLESHVVSSDSHKKSKEEKRRRKKKKHAMEALELLAEASDIAVQDNFVNRTSPPQKISPVPQQVQAVSHVSSTNMPYNPASTSSSNIIKTSLPVTSSNFIPMNNFMKKPKNDKPLVIRAMPIESDKRTSPIENVTNTSFNAVSSTSNNNSAPQNSVYQPISSKTVPVVFSGYDHTSPSNQSDLRFKNNPGTAVTMHCIPNGLQLQQVIIPAGSQQIQVQNSGQFVFASPQNTVRLYNKEQNAQVLNNVRQVNQGFGKAVPQLVAPVSVMQVSKDGMPGLQFQALSTNNTQAYTQVTQSPQFVSIPTYMLANQNTISNSSQQPVMNLQSYQLPQRQMHISGQGNC